MNSTFSRIFNDRLLGRWSMVVAFAAAAFMLLITESAYQNQRKGLNDLVTMGKARLALTAALQRITDAESGQRGYMLVGGKDYLDPYVQARQDVRHALTDIRLLDKELANPEVHASQTRIEALIEQKLSEMEEVMRRYDSGAHEAALEMSRTGIGREIMDSIRTEFDNDLAMRSKLIGAGLTKIHDLLWLERVGIGSMTVLSLVILIMFLRQGQTLATERETQRYQLQQERDNLEDEVERRTSELKDLTRHLQTAREDERARLARDLHDELGALLTTAKLDVAILRPKVQQSLPEMAPKLAHLADALNQGIALKRRIIEDLCPSSLKTLGLKAALESMLDETAHANDLTIAHDIQSPDLSESDRLTAYRVVQETVTNALKHARASKLIVRVFVDRGMAVVEVEDNGKGFDVTAPRTGSHGLQGMRFRVEAAGGRLTLTSNPDDGTCVTACIPLSV